MCLQHAGTSLACFKSVHDPGSQFPQQVLAMGPTLAHLPLAILNPRGPGSAALPLVLPANVMGGGCSVPRGFGTHSWPHPKGKVLSCRDSSLNILRDVMCGHPLANPGRGHQGQDTSSRLNHSAICEE